MEIMIGQVHTFLNMKILFYLYTVRVIYYAFSFAYYNLHFVLLKVQDRVCTEVGVLNEPPIGLGPLLKEAPVW